MLDFRLTGTLLPAGILTPMGDLLSPMATGYLLPPIASFAPCAPPELKLPGWPVAKPGVVGVWAEALVLVAGGVDVAPPGTAGVLLVA